MRQRIGEILLLRESIDHAQLTQAIRDQAERPGDRLVSMLVKRTLIDPDEGALALSEQTGFPAALERHLEARQQETRHEISTELVHRWAVLPIARSREGILVICARDPTPILAAALQHALATPIKLAVTPAFLLERLIVAIYGPFPSVDTTPLLADIGMVPVTQHELRPARTVSRVIRARPESGQLQIPHSLDALEATLQEIDHAFSVAAVERLVSAYAQRRWESALLVKFTEGVALGHRGHGARIGHAEACIIPLSSPSMIQIAHDDRRIATEIPEGEIQERLSGVLGDPKAPVAGPAVTHAGVEAVLIVGDPTEGTLQETIADLEKLLDALGAAYERFARTTG